MKKVTTLLFFTMFILNAESQTNITLQALQDNTIYSDFTGNSNGAGDNFTAGSISVPVRRALIMFDFSAIPAGSTITGASLQLVLNRTVSGATPVDLHRMLSQWGEGISNAGPGADGQGTVAMLNDATWICTFSNGAGGCNSSWTNPGGDFAGTVSASAAVAGPASYIWSSAQLTADIQGWLNGTFNNFGWIIIGDETNSRTAKRFSSRTSPNAAERPQLNITYTPPLPIVLRYFIARENKYGVELSWETAQEINNHFFEIEHSKDAVRFISIGRIKANGNSSQPSFYKYLHQLPDFGKNFYRLRQTDIGGRSTVSDIQQITFSQKTKSLLISPNPVKQVISLPGLQPDENSYYLIFSQNGQELASGKLTTNQITLPHGTLPGLYYIKIHFGDGQVQNANFVKE